MQRARLITIAISHFCEKARWALDHAGVAYDEDAHAPLFHMLETRRVGGRSVPVVVVDGLVLTDSTDILQWADSQCPSDERLYPQDPTERAEVVALEEEFDRVLGPAVRRIAYHHLLPTRGAAAAISRGAGKFEARAFVVGYPIISRLMRRGMRIDAASVTRDQGKLDALLARIEQRLANAADRGDRPYLVGNKFTAADLTFASLAAPLIDVPEYGGDRPLAIAPPALLAMVESLSSSRAGQYVQRIYRDHRRGRPQNRVLP
jgi:glutathione S-transferase